MLTDVALDRLKANQKVYKVADRDGMYVSVATSGRSPSGYDYRLAGRREALALASTSAKSHTTQRGVRKNRFGNSPLFKLVDGGVGQTRSATPLKRP